MSGRDRRLAMASFSVRVVDDDDEGVAGVRVVLSFTSPLRGQSDAERTDEDGYAEFDGYEEGEIKVFLDGSDYGTFDYEDGESITITR
jgi:hypothetical protein